MSRGPLLGAGQYEGDLTRRSDLSIGSLSVTEYAGDTEQASWHAHESFQVSFLVYGRGHATTESGERTARVCVYHPGEAHRFLAASERCVSLNLELTAEDVGRLDLHGEDLVARVRKHPEAQLLLTGMLRELLEPDPSSADSLQVAIGDLVRDPSPEKRPAWVDSVVEQLADRWDETVPLSDLAAGAEVHPVTVSRSFRRQFGCTLGEYQRRRKVERSLPWVLGSDLPLTAIAHRCGFADHSHYTRTFRSLIGSSPAKMRRMAKG